MNVILNLLVVLQILSALVMIGLILVQHGKGADMGAAFGSGASGSLFGASGSANFLSRSTAGLATVFLLSTLGLAYFGFSAPRAAPVDGGSVLERAAVVAPAASQQAASASGAASAATGAADAIPGASLATSAAPAAPADNKAAAATTGPSVGTSGADQIPAK
ncbi:MAG: preprotein translocase subunit SecG [Burkholderiaceae bacterium]|jgi:preprotein translocase subunit SecG|nr:preprotein translocase subunit SecG [Burkholderiaceae bacterium]